MFPGKSMRAAGIAALLCLCTVSARAQRVRGELHLEVHDPQGTAVSPAGELVSEANGFRRTFVAGPEGRYVAQDLPFGVCRRKDSHRGAIWLKFAPRCPCAWP